MHAWSNQTEGDDVLGCTAGDGINTVTNPNWNVDDLRSCQENITERIQISTKPKITKEKKRKEKVSLFWFWLMLICLTCLSKWPRPSA